MVIAIGAILVGFVNINARILPKGFTTLLADHYNFMHFEKSVVALLTVALGTIEPALAARRSYCHLNNKVRMNV